jgi:hypothetical protein
VRPILRVVAISLLLASRVALAQSFTGPAAFDSDRYKPLSGEQRWRRWVREDGGSPAIHVESFATAAWLQAIPAPDAWGRNAGGFIRRVGSS